MDKETRHDDTPSPLSCSFETDYSDAVARETLVHGRPLPESCGIDAVAFDFDGTLIDGSTCSSVFDLKNERHRLPTLTCSVLRWCLNHNVQVGIVSYGITERIKSILNASELTQSQISRIQLLTPSTMQPQFPSIYWSDGTLPPDGLNRVTQLHLFHSRVCGKVPLHRVALFDDNYNNALVAAREGYTSFWLNDGSLSALLCCRAGNAEIDCAAIDNMSAIQFTAFWKSAFVTSNTHARMFVSGSSSNIE